MLPPFAARRPMTWMFKAVNTWKLASSGAEHDPPTLKQSSHTCFKRRGVPYLLIVRWCMLLTASRLHRLSFLYYSTIMCRLVNHSCLSFSTLITSHQLIRVFFLCLFYHRIPPFPHPTISHSITFPQYFFLISIIFSVHGCWLLPRSIKLFHLRTNTHTRTHTHACIHNTLIRTCTVYSNNAFHPFSNLQPIRFELNIIVQYLSSSYFGSSISFTVWFDFTRFRDVLWRQ